MKVSDPLGTRVKDLTADWRTNRAPRRTGTLWELGYWDYCWEVGYWDLGAVGGWEDHVLVLLLVSSTGEILARDRG